MVRIPTRDLASLTRIVEDILNSVALKNIPSIEMLGIWKLDPGILKGPVRRIRFCVQEIGVVK